MVSRKVFLVLIASALVFFLLIIKPSEATRILHEDEEQWMKKNINDNNKEQNLFLMSSLQRGRPSGPPSPNGCTWVPGGGGKPCTTASISQRNFAMNMGSGGHQPLPPATVDDGGAYPEQMVQFGVATGTK